MRNGKRWSKGGWYTNGTVRKKNEGETKREIEKKKKKESREQRRSRLYGSKEGKEMKVECKYGEGYEG